MNGFLIFEVRDLFKFDLFKFDLIVLILLRLALIFYEGRLPFGFVTFFHNRPDLLDHRLPVTY
jgi:hypothetical protein